MDIYQIVANRTGLNRNEVKSRCATLFYIGAKLPESEIELVRYLVNYLKGRV